MALKRSDLTIEKNAEGAWRILATVDGYLQTRRYYGYRKAEAVSLFLTEFN